MSDSAIESETQTPSTGGTGKDALARRKGLSEAEVSLLKARREANLKRRALKGERIRGSKAYRDQYKKSYKDRGKEISRVLRAQNPVTIFKNEHLGLTPEEYEILLQKGKTLDDLPLNKDGTANRQFKSGPKSEDFRHRHKNLRKKYRSEGLPEKTEQSTNHQPRTIKNPLGAGAPVQQVQVSKELQVSKNILESTSKVLATDLDWEQLPGFYDTKYTPETKIHAVTCYIVTGSFSKASKHSAVPEQTIKGWKNKEWFRVVAKYVQQARQEELDASMSEVIHSSMDIVKDRLQTGDYKYNIKTGEIIQIPIPAKDAALIADKIIKNRNLLRGDATSRTDSSSLSEKIMDLKNQFRSFTEQKVIEAEVEVVQDRE